MKRSMMMFSVFTAYLLVAGTQAQAGEEQAMTQKKVDGVTVVEPGAQTGATIVGEIGPAAKQTGGKVTLGPGMQRLVDLAKKDLTARLRKEPSEITVLEAEFVSWRDSSNGCPKPGYQYMQVITNGSRIVLEANGQGYHYHSGGNRLPTLCKKPSPEKPLPYAPGEA